MACIWLLWVYCSLFNSSVWEYYIISNLNISLCVCVWMHLCVNPYIHLCMGAFAYVHRNLHWSKASTPALHFSCMTCCLWWTEVLYTDLSRITTRMWVLLTQLESRVRIKKPTAVQHGRDYFCCSLCNVIFCLLRKKCSLIFFSQGKTIIK